MRLEILISFLPKFSYLVDIYNFLLAIFSLAKISKNGYVVLNILTMFKSFFLKKYKYKYYLNNSNIYCDYDKLLEYIFFVTTKTNFSKTVVFFDSTTYLYFRRDYKKLNILDIGSWLGDSIILFYKYGARKIIAYEPIKENVRLCKELIKEIGLNCKIVEAAVCRKNCIKEFKIDPRLYGMRDFSLFDRNLGGIRKIKIKCVSFRDVIESAIKEKVDLVKVDCEGCEKFLYEVPDKLIEKIPEWIIECHDFGTAKLLYKKFKKVGFQIKKIYNWRNEAYVLYFVK